MDLNDIKAGDKVILNIGGPPMSVKGNARAPNLGKVICTWFAGKKHEEATFAPAQLDRYEEPEAKKK